MRNIILERPEGVLAVISVSNEKIKDLAGYVDYLKKKGDIPKDWVVVDSNVDLPVDNVFRKAWSYDKTGKKVKEDFAKSVEISHNLRRVKRENDFAPYDKVIAAQIPGKAEEAELARKRIREADSAFQDSINSCSDVDSLKNELVKAGILNQKRRIIRNGKRR